MEGKCLHWAIIDIETTGMDAGSDQIIDLGIIEFEGWKKVREYESLVRPDFPLSQFIQKLTGITQEKANRAPEWKKVQLELPDWEEGVILAHNSQFEEKFLSSFIKNPNIVFQDSLPFLGVLCPDRSSLSLEGILVDFGIAQKEAHRGLSDAKDLFKVITLVALLKKQNKIQDQFFQEQFAKLKNFSWWFEIFFRGTKDDIVRLAHELEFDVLAAAEKYNQTPRQTKFPALHWGKDELNYTAQGLEEIYKDEKKIQTVLPFYQFRQEQLDLAKRVGQSFSNQIHGLVQAPTGTGKTLGYLIPAFLHAAEKKEQVLVATGTKALQNQAMEKDIPLVQSLLGEKAEKIKLVKLVGSSNHLCESAFRTKLEKEVGMLNLRPFSEVYAEIFFESIFFHHYQLQKEMHRDSYPGILKRIFSDVREWDKDLAVDYRSCTAGRCPFRTSCTYLKDIRRAKEADIIIGNHAMMLTWPRSIPRPGHIIIDEAHRLEQEATSAYTLVCTEEQIKSLIKQLSTMNGPGALFYLLENHGDKSFKTTIEVIKRETQDLTRALGDQFFLIQPLWEQYAQSQPRYQTQFWNEFPFWGLDCEREEKQKSLSHSLLSMKQILHDLFELYYPHLVHFQSLELEQEPSIMALNRFENFWVAIEDIHQTFLLFLEKDEVFARSIRFLEGDGFQLLVSPIDIGRFLHRELLLPSASVVFTSATLANADGRFGVRQVEWMTGHSYLDPKKRFKQGLFLPPIYDYKNQSKVFLCSDVPSFKDLNFIHFCMDKIVPLIRLIQGRTLMLFSARSRFESACEYLLKHLGSEIPVFIQGLGTQVVEEFKKSPTGVLVGMESFGEGIDIPGENLEFLFIDKIPDLRQDWVIQKRRDFFEKEFGQEFVDYFLTSRARSLHQKFGRLIRTPTDRGCIMVVDERIRKWKGRTLQQFAQLMLPYEIKVESFQKAIEQVGETLAKEKDISLWQKGSPPLEPSLTR